MFMVSGVIIGALLLSGCGLGSSEPELTDFDLQVKPQGRDAPLAVTANLGVTNNGGAEGTVTLRLDGESHDEITVPAGETVETSLDLTVNYGTHTVALGPQTASVEASGLTFEHPATVQVDEPFGLTVKGLPSDAAVTLRVSSFSSQGHLWANETALHADGNLAELPAEELMQLVQLMVPESDDAANSYRPDFDEVGDPSELRIAVKQGDYVLDRTTIGRRWGDPGVSRSEVEAEGLVGWLYEPAGDGPAPPVVLLHGSEGNVMHHSAGMLASHGFLALALQYFGEPAEIPDYLFGVPIQYVQRAGEWLLQRERASGDQVGLWGGSRGGELALLAASHFDVFGAVVATSGSGVTWGGWTHQSKLLPQLLGGINLLGSALADIDDERLDDIDDERLADATIPVERIDGPVLMVSGRRDRLWNAVTFSEIAVERLERHDHPYPYQHLIYDEAGHAMLVPYQPMPWADVNRDMFLRKYGGTREGAAEASADHWPKALKFLRRGLTSDKEQ